MVHYAVLTLYYEELVSHLTIGLVYLLQGFIINILIVVKELKKPITNNVLISSTGSAWMSASV